MIKSYLCESVFVQKSFLELDRLTDLGMQPGWTEGHIYPDVPCAKGPGNDTLEGVTSACQCANPRPCGEALWAFP